ncbi:MAG: hypothetical protein JXA37_05150 [Chloroflexia bacterium]|nr:hypothetical protein [Chloroflexia bacterium]
MAGHFEHLFVLGRPACGKSEFIDYMQHQDDRDRRERYHLGRLHIVDDFVFLWDYFLDDDVREAHGRPRIYSQPIDPGGYETSESVIWYLLIDRINRAVRKCLKQPTLYQDHTMLIEFARGTEQGYRRALENIDPPILARSAILYIAVSFKESWRRNIARYDEKRKAGILTHMVSREAMERVYSLDDWSELAPAPAGYLDIGGAHVPYVTMDNEPESTDPTVLDERYGTALRTLWDLTRAR